MKLAHGTMGLAVGSKLPLVQIRVREPVADHDNGLELYFYDAPESEPTIEDCHTICVHCILKSHPTIGKGVRIANEHGLAVFVDGRWQPGREPSA